MALTMEKLLQAEKLGLDLALDGVRLGTLGGGARAAPEHLALAQAHGVQVLAQQLQDEASVQDVQQLVGIETLLVAGDVLGAGEAHLLQAHGPEELFLCLRGLQLTVEEPAAMGVADGEGTGWPSSVLELDLQIGHCRVEEQAGPSIREPESLFLPPPLGMDIFSFLHHSPTHSKVLSTLTRSATRLPAGPYVAACGG